MPLYRCLGSAYSNQLRGSSRLFPKQWKGGDRFDGEVGVPKTQVEECGRLITSHAGGLDPEDLSLSSDSSYQYGRDM